MNNAPVRMGMTITIIAVPFVFGIVAILTLSYMAGIDLSALKDIPTWQTYLMTLGLLFISFIVMLVLVAVFNNILDKDHLPVNAQGIQDDGLEKEEDQ